MRKNFNAQKYNEKIDKIVEECKKAIQYRERINPLKTAISVLDDWELQEIKEFVNNGLERSRTSEKLS